MKKVTVYNRQVDALYQDNIEVIIEEIKNGRYKNLVEDIRNHYADGNIEEAEKAKNRLPWFTVSGIMDEGHTEKPLIEYSGLIALETEDIDIENAGDLINKIDLIPTTLSRFQSTQANKITIIVAVDSNVENHKEAFTQVAEYYETELGVKLDRLWSEITKPCYFSYDPNLYYNPKSEQFKIVLDGGYSETSTMDNENINRGPTKNDENDDDVARFAQFAHPTQNITLNANISNNQDFQAYLKEEIKEELFEKLSKTPFLPDEIFQDLPEILKLTCLLFPNKRERDLYLLGAITVLSGIMPNVSGTYDQKTVYSNLYSFIVAPAANGKGSLSYAQNLVRHLHEHLIELYTEKQKEYEVQMETNAESKKAGRRRNAETIGTSDTNTEPPISNTVPSKPKRKMLLIPANSSSASMLQILYDSDGTGIIFDTEADTLAESFNQKWGNFSDALRKAFHHESITSSRKENETLIEIPLPKISVVLSGTLSQVKAIFHTAENGLVSRFMFYAFRNDSGWKDVSTINKENLTEKFNTLKNWVTGIYYYLNIHRSEFDLTQHQWQKFNERFGVLLPHFKSSDGDVAGGMIVRLGLITYRIAMIFTALRKCENKHEDLNIVCSDTDFNIAMDIVDVLKEHSMFILDLLPDSELSDRDKNRKRLFDALPDNQFRRDTAITIGKNLGIQKRTVDKYLKKLTLIGMLESIPFVGYKKIK